MHWPAFVRRIFKRSGNYESEATLFHELLAELDSAGAFAGTWIEPRWHAAQARIAEED